MKKVTVYSTPTCPYCKMAKQFLADNKIDYKDVDLSMDQEAVHMLMEKTGHMGVPVTIIEKDEGEDIILGFNQEKFKLSLGL